MHHARMRLKAELWHGSVNRTDVVEGILASEDDAFDAEFFHHGGAGGVVHRHLRGAVNFELGIDLLNQADEPAMS